MNSIILTEVNLLKYKSYETPQTFKVDPSVTVLVGKNESGKTAVLEAITKTRHFQGDEKFKFNVTHDYPRKEKKRFEKSEERGKVITCSYHIGDTLWQEIEDSLGKGVLKQKTFSITTFYDNKSEVDGIVCDLQTFLESYIVRAKALESDRIHLTSIRSRETIEEIRESVRTAHKDKQRIENETAAAEGKTPMQVPTPTVLEHLNTLDKFLATEGNWQPLQYYCYKTFIQPNLPKFLYYDEYYALPSRVDIEVLNSGHSDEPEKKTSMALFDLADINVSELIGADSFENYIAELEATGNHITAELFKYWKTNTELKVRFAMDRKLVGGNTHHILDIRVENTKHQMSLPLGNRSKGFNWFFSFIVWFSKIQEDKKSNYVLLLDEPGLNLHASAQADLLRYIEDLSQRYQILYTTHSPFMVDSENLQRVRTIYDGDQGSTISESVDQKDRDTLFPLQAALGYDIAQNLFVSRNNLIVEGVSDLVYLTIMSSILEASGHEGLSSKITVVPVGGLDKVASFIALLRSSKLNLVCLLDSFSDPASRQRLDDLIRHKIIKQGNVLFFDQFTDVGKLADIEDLFDKSEYVKLFNQAFANEKISVNHADLTLKQPILPQIAMITGKPRFNHYRPANHLAVSKPKASDFSDATIERFRLLFEQLNSLVG